MGPPCSFIVQDRLSLPDPQHTHANHTLKLRTHYCSSTHTQLEPGHRQWCSEPLIPTLDVVWIPQGWACIT